jgi:hypothetical protein
MKPGKGAFAPEPLRAIVSSYSNATIMEQEVTLPVPLYIEVRRRAVFEISGLALLLVGFVGADAAASSGWIVKTQAPRHFRASPAK